MPFPPPKPILFTSYAHADEPERPAVDEVKWLSFVTGYLRPAVKHGAVEIWIDALMKGGADWPEGLAASKSREHALDDLDPFGCGLQEVR